MTRGRSRFALFVLVFPWVVAACAGILGIHDKPKHAFEHRAHVLRGIACVQCHTEVQAELPNATIAVPSQALCTTCHADPHIEETCSNCHGREQDRRDAAQAKLHLNFSHAAHAGTAQGDCGRCHSNVLSGDGPLRPTMATCLGCHEHAEQWEKRQCTPCHLNLEDEHARPESHVVHGQDFMQRHGTAAASSRELCSTCHTESQCAACHGVNVPALPQTLHFEDPNRPDMHARGFFARHSIEARIDPTTCTSCHRDASYCQDCHRREGLLEVSATRGSPHPVGWVGTTPADNRHGLEARSNPVACASCHGGSGEMLCVGCHRVGGPGGNPHPPSFRSSKPASELPCRLCHTQEPR